MSDETIELFDESDKITDQKKQNQEEEAKKAEEMQKRSLETFQDSAKRNANDHKEQDRKRVELVVQTLWLTSKIGQK